MVRYKSLFALATVVALSSAQAAGDETMGRTTADILDHYSFVGDFNQKEETREISTEVFWRYPLPLPKIEFPIHPTLDDPKKEMPATRGAGRPISHLNRGRLLFLDGDFTGAKGTWLSARARYGTSYPMHRRDDYFIGYAFLNIANQLMKQKGLGYDAVDVRTVIANAGTFLSWAFIVKVDDHDPLVEAVTPKGLYNLAALYWRYDRYAGSFGAATTGLNFLRRTGRKEYRAAFHRFSAEAYIKNRTYLEAVQELDTSIRQDRDPAQASAAFARVGDIYFDLNNYELAEDAYELAGRVDADMQQINPSELVLRGESLFWLGRFSEAQRILHYAIEGVNYNRKVIEPLDHDYLSWASLRIADAFLAQHEWEKAKLEYFKVGHAFRGSLAGRVAMVREACLELPFYQGHNVQHARQLIDEAKAEIDMPGPAKELGWACQVGSYTDRERTPEMLERVKQFADNYPTSNFLKSFAEPVRSYQAAHIDDYFKAGDTYRALSFFEKNRKTLFPHISDELAQKLFVAYADTGRATAAAEFWGAYGQVPDSDMKRLRQAVVVAEVLASTKAGPAPPVWRARASSQQQALVARAWELAPDRLAELYFNRMQLASTDQGDLLWLLGLARHFGAKDYNFICDLEYPMLSRLNSLGASYTKLVEKRTDELISTLLPDLFRHDESCALSLLDLEGEFLRLRPPSEVAALYLKRRDWPLVSGFLHKYWAVSEYVYDAGDAANARKLWEVVRDKGTANSPEVDFAKARLDPTRTEFEKLWN